MNWLIILGAITGFATFYSQMTAGIKNTMDIYYKIKEEREKSRSHQEDDSNQ